MPTMALAEQLQTDLTAAMKARDGDTVKTLRMVVAAVRNARVEAGRSAGVDDEEVLGILAREAKRRTEAAEAYDAADRPELAATERAELEIIRRYLPAQLDDAELQGIVDAAVAETGAAGPGDLGAVMSAVMPQVKGRADGKQVSAMVRARLG
jgi:uncharacterized protein YqeY